MRDNLVDDLLTLSPDDNIMEPKNNAKECTITPRPKRSKNKKSLVVVDIINNIDRKIVAVESADSFADGRTESQES